MHLIGGISKPELLSMIATNSTFSLNVFPLDKPILSEYPIDRLFSIELIDYNHYRTNDD